MASVTFVCRNCFLTGAMDEGKNAPPQHYETTIGVAFIQNTDFRTCVFLFSVTEYLLCKFSFLTDGYLEQIAGIKSATATKYPSGFITASQTRA
jgi:hypothetical protein